MQITDEMVNRVDSVLSKVKGGIPDTTIRLALEAALSAAEPVGFGVFNKNGDFQFACVSKEDAEKEANWEGDTVRHIFAAPPALSARVQDVAGWQLVPKEPTQEMCEAAPSLPAIHAIDDLPLKKLGWSMSAIVNRKRYLAMLAAAPAKQEG